MNPKNAFPLSWPEGWKRTAPSERIRAVFGVVTANQSQFGSRSFKRPVSVFEAGERVRSELERMGVRDWEYILSTNLELGRSGRPRSSDREPTDPGAAVYWRLKGKDECMAIDRYTRVADNLAAIAATISALRAIERHGGAEILDRAFRGFAALPETGSGSSWRVTFGFPPNAAISREEMESRFRELAKSAHADAGGSDDRMRELIEARALALREL